MSSDQVDKKQSVPETEQEASPAVENVESKTKNDQGGQDTLVTVGNGEDEGTKEAQFKNLTVDEAIAKLQTTKKGLTQAEAESRLAQYGPNKLPEEKKNKFLIFLGFLWNPLSWCMEVAAIIALFVLDYVDVILIIFLLLINAVIGYYEECNADDAISALMQSLAPKAKVYRDGAYTDIEASDLVPGDVIMIRLGDIVPADIKLLDGDYLLCDQAALTGESLPVKKYPGQLCYSGSAIKQGEENAVVYATGIDTFFGQAAKLIGETENSGHLQHVLALVGGGCVVTIVIWVAIELGVAFGYYNHSCYLGVGQCPTLENILVIIVGGIPVAMPTVLSVTLAMGSYQLAKEGAIVSRLTAIEELAGMDMLCSDKTGTLTQNKLTVDHDKLKSTSNFEPNDILKYGALGARIENNEPIDVCCHKACPDADKLWDDYECVKYVPFNPTDKRTVAYITEKSTGKQFKAIKGAPQIVLQSAHNFQEIKDEFEGTILEYASRGFRALGVGYVEGHGEPANDKIEFVGLIPIFDEPRHDTKDTIEKCIHMGVGVKMITGDQLPIAIETAKMLGMGIDFHTTEIFNNPTGLVQGTIALDDLCENADGFAEVFPEHKFDIVARLQHKGHITGMTGDGVNDAPALKKADIGVAVADATDAARAAADIVLTQEGLGTIVTAITNSRKIFQRMKNYSIYTIAMTFRICFTFGLLTVIFDWYFPTILIVILAILNDGAMISLSKDRVSPSPDPDAWFLKRIFCMAICYGLYLTVSTIVLFEVAGQGDWFSNRFNMYSFNIKSDAINQLCTPQVLGIPDVNVPVNTLPGYGSLPNTVSIFQQCTAENLWYRSSRLRALVYLQVSISGQALIFNTRTRGFFFSDRPGYLLLCAFVLAQIAASLIGGFGFNGYPSPHNGVNGTFIFDVTKSFTAPVFGSENVFAQSVIGCGAAYVLVAWVWAIVWYIPIDFIKFILEFVLYGHFPSLFGSNLNTRRDIVNPHFGGRASKSSATIGRRSTGRARSSQVTRGSVY